MIKIKMRILSDICRVFLEEFIIFILQGYTFDDIREGALEYYYNIHFNDLTYQEKELFKENNKDIMSTDPQFKIAFNKFIQNNHIANRVELADFIRRK